MKKRITAVMMAAALSLLAAGVPVYALDESTLTVPISATVMSSYTVVLPSVTQTLADEDNDGTFTGTIGYDAYGKINADKALVVMAGDGTGLSYAQDIINLPDLIQMVPHAGNNGRKDGGGKRGADGSPPAGKRDGDGITDGCAYPGGGIRNPALSGHDGDRHTLYGYLYREYAIYLRADRQIAEGRR